VEAGSVLQDGVWRVLLVMALVGINAATVGLYALDKRAAKRRGARRIPERTLHTLELLGGWPGAWFAQRWLRHKTLKPSYRRTFHGIVALHVLVAAAVGAGWLMTRAQG